MQNDIIHSKSEQIFKQMQKNTRDNMTSSVEKMAYFGTPTEEVLNYLILLFKNIKTETTYSTIQDELTTLIKHDTNGIMVGVAEWRNSNVTELAICFSGDFQTSERVWRAKRTILEKISEKISEKIDTKIHLFDTKDDYTCNSKQLLYSPFLRFKHTNPSNPPKAANGSTCVEPKMYYYLCQKGAKPTGFACVFLPIELFVSEQLDGLSMTGKSTIEKYNLQPDQRAIYVKQFIGAFPKLKANKDILAIIVEHMAYPCPGCQMNHDAIVNCVPPTYTRLTNNTGASSKQNYLSWWQPKKTLNLWNISSSWKKKNTEPRA